MDKVFDALASTARREILVHLSDATLSAGDIASRFDMTKPSVSKHLQILVNAGLIHADKRGQFVFYTLQRDTLVNALSSFAHSVCPAPRSPEKENKTLARRRR